MDKILLIVLVAVIFIIAWITGKKKPVKSAFEEKNLSIADVPKLFQKKQISGKLFVRKYPTINERNRIRKEKHWMMKYNLLQQGIVRHNNKLYWATRELAEANG